ncbi:MAG: hypothetical protein ABI672_17755 [Vicinamibacteria bacterium]
MFTRRSALSLITAGSLLGAALGPASAQQVVVGGPPPALRKSLDGFQKAFNSGSADDFEAMAKSTYTAEELKRQTAADRKKEYLKWHADFGTIQFRGVERRGPDAPLEISVKGSVASGIMWIEVDDASRIDRVKAEVETKKKE